jgi:hypothetical protein
LTLIFQFPAQSSKPANMEQRFRGRLGVALSVVIFAAVICLPLHAARKDKTKDQFGAGFTTEVIASKEELVEAVQDVAGNGIIKGSKEYDKDTYISGASPADSSPLFPKWTGPGQVFFKVRTGCIAPRNFRDSGDSGTLAVRYVVQSKDATHSILRIDAMYEESERNIFHPSNGTVESSEYRDVQDNVDGIQLKKKQAIEGEKNRQEELARRSLDRSRQADNTAVEISESSPQGLEQHVQELRRQLERVVRSSGAQLKASPFHTAATLQSLAPGTEVVILIDSPYWLGIETQDGQHGWVKRDQLEALP